ncbi:MAG: dephospho-CoA kinase [Actinomycetia bacterium]|nr:dephospho-CoA kinase [Actinomycetes bacterium]
MSDSVSRTPRPVVLIGGGIGAGKTSVSGVFSDHGFTIVSTDDIGRDVLGEGSPVVETVGRLWPAVVKDGVVDRGALAQIVFADASALEELESITHPIIERRARNEIAASERPVAVEVPVMKVFGNDPFTRIAVVADVDVRIARAVARGAAREDVLRRMERQPTGDEWRAWADVAIDNSGAWARTEMSVEGIIRRVTTDG